MGSKRLKTSEAQAHREAVRKYEKNNDRINVIFPAGTREKMQNLGIKNHSAFIKDVIASELEKMEKYQQKK